METLGPPPLEPHELRRVEHLGAATGLGLAELARDLAGAAGLPDFELALDDAGAARGWSRGAECEVELHGPFPEGLLRAWDRAFPAAANVLVLLKVPCTGPEPAPDLVPRLGRLLAGLTGATVVHAGTTELVPHRHDRPARVAFDP